MLKNWKVFALFDLSLSASSKIHARLKQHSHFNMKSTAAGNFILTPRSDNIERFAPLKTPLAHFYLGVLCLEFQKDFVRVLSSICLGWLTNILIASRFLTISFLFPVGLEMPGLDQKSCASFRCSVGMASDRVRLCKASTTCCS